MHPDKPEQPPEPAADDFTPDLDPALEAARKAVVAREERRKEERRSGRDRRQRPLAEPMWRAAASASWLVVFLILLTPPAFLRAPAPRPYRPPAEATEASLRFGLWLANHRIELFLAGQGRLPSFLGETGAGDPAITMELVLTDATAAEAFLGNSLTMLSGE